MTYKVLWECLYAWQLMYSMSFITRAGKYQWTGKSYVSGDLSSYFFLSNSSTFMKWQTGLKMCLGHTEFLDLVTDEQADVCCRAIWSLIVPFHTLFPLTVGHLLQENELIWFGWLFCLHSFICNFFCCDYFLKIRCAWILSKHPPVTDALTI